QRGDKELKSRSPSAFLGRGRPILGNSFLQRGGSATEAKGDSLSGTQRRHAEQGPDPRRSTALEHPRSLLRPAPRLPRLPCCPPFAQLRGDTRVNRTMPRGYRGVTSTAHHAR